MSEACCFAVNEFFSARGGCKRVVLWYNSVVEINTKTYGCGEKIFF